MQTAIEETRASRPSYRLDLEHPMPAVGDAPVLFSLDKLEVFYGAFRAVRDVSLQIHEHEITAFIGPSGCGKTTVLRCLNRMNDLIPGARIAGGITFHGIDLYGHDVSATGSETIDGETVGEKQEIQARHIIIATGARARELPSLPVDGQKIITYKEAMLQTERPGSMLIVGAGAIGVEFAYVYHHMGTEVTVVELMDRLVPVEDRDVSKELERAYKKMGIKTMTASSVENVDTSGERCVVTVKTKKGNQTVEVDQVLSAVGVVGNVEGIGLDEVGVTHERGAIKVDEFYHTNVEGVYAIGDVIGAPWLAHVASHEGLICVEMIAHQEGKLDHAPRPVDYKNVPGCTYCLPQIASVGYTEEAAKEAGFEVKVGKFPFSASGKAAAIGDQTGFCKVVFDAAYGEWLGCHIVGPDATELIAEAVAARTLETTGHEILETMHPHPTLSEAVLEAVRDAYGMPINA